MRNVVEISCIGIEEPAWTDRLEHFLLKLLDHLDIDSWEVSVVLCDDLFIQDLNMRYRGKNYPTDVLSFPQVDGTADETGTYPAGDIIISLPVLKRNAENFNVLEEQELRRLIIHGILHLSGMDHATNEPEEEMLSRQEKILKSLEGETIF